MNASPEYEAKRAARITKRQERETKRKYEFLAGQVRSQLRKQLDEILKLNTKAFVLLLLEGGALKVGVEAMERPEPVIDVPAVLGAGQGELPMPTMVDREAAVRAIEYDPKTDRFEDEMEDPVPVPPPLIDVVR